MGETTTTPTTPTTRKEEEEEDKGTEEETTSLELALDALRSANEEILEKEERERGEDEEGFASNATSKFDLLEKVLAKFTTNTTREDEGEKTGKKTPTTQQKKKICAA